MTPWDDDTAIRYPVEDNDHTGVLHRNNIQVLIAGDASDGCRGVMEGKGDDGERGGERRRRREMEEDVVRETKREREAVNRVRLFRGQPCLKCFGGF